MSYSHPVFDGYGRLQLEATQNLTYESGDFTVNGVLFEEGGDRLGFSNVNQSGSLTNEWRANATASWSNERHNVSLRANYISGITDDRSILGGFTAIDLTGPAPVYSLYGVNPEDYVDFDLTYIYSVPAWEELDLRLTILNIADEDPMAYQSPEGYYGGLGNPRGRQVEFAATKKF